MSPSVIIATRYQIHWLQLSACIPKNAQAMCKYALDVVKRVNQLVVQRVISEIGVDLVMLATQMSRRWISMASIVRAAFEY